MPQRWPSRERVGVLSYKAHEEREAGFLHVIDEMFPRLEVVGLREGQDDAGKNYRQTRALPEQHPDMGGNCVRG